MTFGILSLKKLSVSSPVVRLSLRTGLAAAAAIAISEMFSLGHGYWIIMTVFIVTKANLGGTVLRSKERIIGTALGSLIGLPLLLLLSGNPAALIAALAAVLAVYGLIGQLSYTIVATVITVAVYLLFGVMGADASAMLSERVLDTVLGAVAGTAFSLILLPDTARSRLRQRQAETLEQLGEALDYLQGRRRGNPMDLPRYKTILGSFQKDLADCLALYQEAAHEPGRRRYVASSGRINERLKIIHASLVSLAGPIRRLENADPPPELVRVLDLLDDVALRELACTVETLRTGHEPGCAPDLEAARGEFRQVLGRLRDQGTTPDQTILDAALHLRRTRRFCEELQEMRQAVY